MCHVQEVSRRRWRKVLSLGRLPGTISCLTWDRQPAGEHHRHCTTETLCSQMAKYLFLPLDCSGMLDQARGLLPAGRLGEEPGA